MEWQARKTFLELTPVDPSPRMTLEYKGCPPACRLIDLFCPIGYGTRGLIVSPPKAGKDGIATADRPRYSPQPPRRGVGCVVDR